MTVPGVLCGNQFHYVLAKKRSMGTGVIWNYTPTFHMNICSCKAIRIDINLGLHGWKVVGHSSTPARKRTYKKMSSYSQCH